MPGPWPYGSGPFGGGTFGEGNVLPVSVAIGNDPAEVGHDATGMQARRGFSLNGVTEKPEPGAAVVTLRGETYSPLTNPRTRRGQRLQLQAADGSAFFTGTIERSWVTIDPQRNRMLVHLEAYDAIPDLAAVSYETGPGGSFGQRATTLLNATTVPYQVTDSSPDEATTELPTTGRTVLDQLVLARDSTHGWFFVDRHGVVQVYGDPERNSTPAAITLTDGSVPGWGYIYLDPGFDSDDLVGELTVETLTAGDPDLDVFTDDRAAEWGRPQRQTITVNSGLPDTHALRYLNRLPGPALNVKEVTLNATRLDAFSEVAALELYQALRIVRDGLVDAEHQVIALEHTVTPRAALDPKWMCRVTTRQREVNPIRWDEMPPTFTWNDFPAGLTWDDLVAWKP